MTDIFLSHVTSSRSSYPSFLQSQSFFLMLFMSFFVFKKKGGGAFITDLYVLVLDTRHGVLIIGYSTMACLRSFTPMISGWIRIRVISRALLRSSSFDSLTRSLTHSFSHLLPFRTRGRGNRECWPLVAPSLIPPLLPFPFSIYQNSRISQLEE